MQVAAHNVLDVVQPAVMVVAVFVPVFMVMRVLMVVRMFMIVRVLMVVRVFVVMGVFVVMRMAVLVVEALLLGAVDRDGHVRAGDPALHGGVGLKAHARNAEAVELVDERFPVGQKLQQRGGQHVAGSAHAAVKVQGFHRLIPFSFSCGARFSRLPAACPCG